MKETAQTPEFPRDWTPPDGLGASRMRAVSLTGAGIAISVVAVALAIGSVAAGVALGLASDRQAKNQRRIAETGAPAGAVVTQVWRSGGKDRQPWVAYSFESDGRIYLSRARAPLGIWKTLKPGSHLPVRFLPSDPSLNHPVDWAGDAIPAFVPLLAAAGLAGPALLIAAMVRRQKRLLSDGRPAPGVVTRHSRADHGKTRNHYQFRLLSGALAKGRSEGRRPLPLGSILCVMYDPDNPRRNTPYPMTLVRLADEHGGARRDCS